MKSVLRVGLLIVMALVFNSHLLKAQDPYLGEIRMFAGNFAPRGWAFCEGQQLPIATNSALYSLLGTMYGGDGRVTFGLPDLRGRVPIHPSMGKGSSNYQQGQMGGSDQITLQTSNLPPHFAGVPAVSITSVDQTAFPEGNKAVLAVGAAPSVNVNTQILGTGLPVNNMQPYTVVRYIIAIEGSYPTR